MEQPPPMRAKTFSEKTSFFTAARARLSERHGVRVQIAPMDVLPDSIRRYDHHRRRLLLSELLAGPGRSFAVAYQLALQEHDGELNALVERAGAPVGPTRTQVSLPPPNR